MVFPDKNTGVGCHLLLQGIIPSQESNSGILHYRQVLYHLSHWESPMVGLIVHKCWARALVNKNKGVFNSYSVQFSCSVMSNSLWPHGLQHTRLPCPSSTPGAFSNSCPLSQWCHSPSHPLSSPSPPAFNLSQHQGLFQWVSSLHQKAKVSEFQLQHQSFQQLLLNSYWVPIKNQLSANLATKSKEDRIRSSSCFQKIQNLVEEIHVYI